MFVEKENSLNESDSQAEYLCRQAMAKAGFAYGDAPATFHWSQLVSPMGDKMAAKAAYEKLLQEEPENKSALEGIAFIYQTLGNHDEAQKYRKRLRKVEAKNIGVDVNEHPEALDYLLAKTGEAPQPERVPPVYVGAHFDRYAPDYDEQLCEFLSYKGHLLIEEECRRVVLDKSGTALDIGCGTGLTGQSIHDLFSTIDGVDLSEKMLEVAKSRQVYRSLEQQDLNEYLVDKIDEYDVVTASDVLIYLGDLTEVFRLTSQALKNNGYFLFTLEKGHTETYCLRNTGRFQHNADYINDLAEKNGFQIDKCREEVLRINDGQDVNGYIFTLKKSS